MKEQILKLRAEGKSYNEIKEILGCSKGTISYHCGKGQKEKTTKRRQKRRENILLKKVESYKHRKTRKDVVESVRKFQKRDNNSKGGVNKDINTTFTWEDVIAKVGADTVCYLSGEKIDLYSNEYQLDHKIPASKGGENTLDNLGITHRDVNQMKRDLTIDELLEWCEKILKYNGYKIYK